MNLWEVVADSLVSGSQPVVWQTVDNNRVKLGGLK